MITGVIRGKALITYTRVEDSPYMREPRFDVHVAIQSCTPGRKADGSWCAADSAQEDLGLGVNLSGFRPSITRRMKVGETWRIAVVFELTYSRDYWGEHDIDADFPKARVLRRQRAKTIYITKGKR